MTSVTNATSSLPPSALPVDWTLADLQGYLGGIPLSRIRLYPPPGMATEEHAISIDEHEDRLCELVDGVLVEKDMGTYESILAGILIHWLHEYIDEHPVGIVLAPDGMLRILPSRMRIPDVCFVHWDRFPNQQLPRDRVFRVAPDLAVEILSEGNTEGEMTQKLEDYFSSGVRLVWYIEPKTRSLKAFSGPTEFTQHESNDLVDGRDVLPGFEFRLGDLFTRADHR